MKRVLRILMVCFLTFMQAKAEVTSQADSLFQVAMFNVETGDWDASVKAFQNVLKVDDDYILAYVELARVYLKMDTPDSRFQAERAIKQAIRRDPNNEMYQLLLGDINLFRGFRYNAGDHYDRILKRFPNAAEVAYQAGRNAVQEFMLTKDRPLDVPSASQVLTQKEWDRAMLLLEKSIELNPDYRDAYYQLGLVHLEHGRPDGLMQVMNRLLTRFPKDKDGLMFLALAYLEDGKFLRANELFQEALVQMASDERTMMEDIDLITADDDQLVLANTTPETWVDSPEYRRFWIQRDPVLLTDVNERRIEHYRRVSYANLRFSVPSRNEVGWKTVRGQTYIKFGHYLHRRLSFRDGKWGTLYTEIWYYEEFSFTFRSKNGLDNWGFAGDVGRSSAPDLLGDFSPTRDSDRLGFTEDGERMSLQRLKNISRRVNAAMFQMRDREAFEKKPPRFIDPFDKQKYSLPHLMAAFRERDSVRIELSYAVPVEKLEQKDDGFAVDDGVFVFDHQWNDVYRQIFQLAGATEMVANLSDRHLLRSRTFRVNPGDYYMVTEVGDRKGGSIGTFRGEHRWAVPDTGLAMSDLLLARQIHAVKKFPDRREDLDIIPNPVRSFLRGHSAFVYLEIYNLAKNEFGRTRYDLAYRIGVPKKDDVDPALFNAVAIKESGGRLIVTQHEDEDELGERVTSTDISVEYVLPERNRLSESLQRLLKRGRQSETVIVSEYAGDRADDFTFLEISLKEVPPGIYKLTVTATDVMTGQVATRDELFRVME